MGENDTIILPGLEDFVYRGPTYLKLEQKLKSNPIIYNLILQNIAKTNNLTKEIVTYKDANRNTWYEVDVPKGFLNREWLYKQGGKMNTLQFLKNGSGIHIKKKNRGKLINKYVNI